MRGKPNRIALVALGLLVLIIIMGAFLDRGSEGTYPHARYSDSDMAGGKGLRLVLERLGYQTQAITTHRPTPPPSARVWLLLDRETRFTRAEAEGLLEWVRAGGLMIYAAEPCTHDHQMSESEGIKLLRGQLRLAQINVRVAEAKWPPATGVLSLDTVTPYRSGVKNARGSMPLLEVESSYTEIAGNPLGPQLAAIDYGRGRVILAPDATLFTNFGLAQADNAVLVTNFIRYHAANGLVVFDERNHGEDGRPDSLAYLLWQPPLRYMWLQLALAGLMIWVLASRRQGAPVPLPGSGPVTRASQFAGAMGSLFKRVNRPRVAAAIIGENFRRQLALRIGMSPADPDETLAKRAHELTGLPVDLLDKLLLQSRNPATNEHDALRDAQAMERVLRKLGVQRENSE